MVSFQSLLNNLWPSAMSHNRSRINLTDVLICLNEVMDTSQLHPVFSCIQTKGPNNRNSGDLGSDSQGIPESTGAGSLLNLASKWRLKWETAGAISCKETQKLGLCCTLSDGHRHNKAAGRISKGLYQSPAGFTFSQTPLWMFRQRPLESLLRLD